MDNLYQDLNKNNGSVHLSNYPIYNEKLVDKVLERKIRLSQEICSLALSLRKKEKSLQDVSLFRRPDLPRTHQRTECAGRLYHKELLAILGQVRTACALQQTKHCQRWMALRYRAPPTVR